MEGVKYTKYKPLTMKENKICPDKIFKEIEKEFDTEHLCDCEKWCDCWEKFKERFNKESCY